MTFSSLVSLAFPRVREMSLGSPAQSPILNASLPPDEHLLCFDYLYWTSTFEVLLILWRVFRILIFPVAL